MRHVLFAACLAVSATLPLAAQQSRVFTHADTLHGSNTPGRAWWDAEFYDLHVAVHPADSSIAGWNGITYRVLQPASVMQIDLQVPPREHGQCGTDHRAGARQRADGTGAAGATVRQVGAAAVSRGCGGQPVPGCYRLVVSAGTRRALNPFA